MNTENSIDDLAPLIRSEDAAKYLCISKSSLEKGRAAGNEGYPPFCQIGKSTIRYRRSDLLSWVETNLNN